MAYGSPHLSVPNISIVDYGLGNLQSIKNALEAIGVTYSIVSSETAVASASKLLLPGVGTFRVGMENLHRLGLVCAIRKSAAEGVPILGICLGMQLLHEEGDEGGRELGLGLIPGRVKKLRAENGVRIPHMGFNEVNQVNASPLFNGIPDKTDFYFVHTYHAAVSSERDIIAKTSHGVDFVSAVACGNIFGTQFHPEKSQGQGLRLLMNFSEI